MINFCESHPVHKLNLRYLRHDNWEDSLPLLDGVLLLPLGDYIVGPLNSKALSGYETYNINHRKLTSLLNSTGKDFILVYKYNRNIFKNFKNYNIAMVNSIGEFTKDYKAAEDVIITNLDINVN